MARGCSGSDSEEEERHDRFKSERNPTSAVKPLSRSLPSSLDNYASRSRSPVRSNSSKNIRHRSKYSEESSVSRRDKSRERKRSRERKTSRERDRNSGSSEDKKSKSRSSYEKKSDIDKERYVDEPRKRSREKDENPEGIIKERDHKCKDRERKRKTREKDRNSENNDGNGLDKNSKFERNSSNSDSEYLKEVEIVDDKDPYNDLESHVLPRYYEIVDECAEDSEGSLHHKSVSEGSLHHKSVSDEKPSRKHKRSREKSQNHHESKKRKKEKKHKRKHEKRKSGDDTNPLTDTPMEKNVLIPTDDIVLDNVSDDMPLETNLSDHNKSDSEHEEGELSGSESEQYFGPALPPRKMTEENLCSPSLPAVKDQYGPALPPTVTSREDELELGGEDVIGPLPVGKESLAQAALDIRASLLKKQMDNKIETDVVRREEWMTELPDSKRIHLGLGPRKFRTNAAPDMSDRSSWTDTPKDKAQKQLMGEEEELNTKKLEVDERNKEMELLAKKSDKREKSLLEMHQKEIRKKKKKEEKERGDSKPERRPFSREIDLQTNKFDEAQKRSIIKKAQLLDSRFSSGESKYL